VKHQEFKLSAHCHSTECQEKHLKKQLKLPTDELLRTLEEMTTQDAQVDRILKQLDVPYIQVSFEKLYYSDSAEEWMRIFRFLGVGPTQGLTMEEVNAAMKHLSTSNPKHEDTLKNYDEVASVLKGTEFEELLHRR
jgi:phosphoglycolate phosphatase-like HAD superfamily hydrolase